MTLTTDALDWVRFSDQESEPCDGTWSDPCSMEAVARSVWDAPCLCYPDVMRMCAAHRDDLLAEVASGGRDFVCRGCEGPVALLRIEPIR